MKKTWIIGAAALALLLFSSRGNKAFGAVVTGQRIRGCDPQGCGSFGAPRSDHTHQGIDIVAAPGAQVFAPISGTVTRHSVPYADDPRFKGIEISSPGYSVKIFYCNPSVKVGAQVSVGEVIATAQDLRIKYPAITNHLHVEVRDANRKIIDPTKLIL